MKMWYNEFNKLFIIKIILLVYFFFNLCIWYIDVIIYRIFEIMYWFFIWGIGYICDKVLLLK